MNEIRGLITQSAATGIIELAKLANRRLNRPLYGCALLLRVVVNLTPDRHFILLEPRVLRDDWFL